jgi:hypothetical protein
MAQWLNGSMAQWLNGSMAQWLNFRCNLENYKIFPEVKKKKPPQI